MREESTRCVTACPASCDRGDPHRTGDGGGFDHALSRTASQCAVHILPHLIEILELLDNLEIDAGITYLGNEPLGRGTHAAVSTTSATGCSRQPMRRSAIATCVTRAEVAQVPLCLLTPDMQNRRIIDRRCGARVARSRPTLNRI
jgi:hypothetical protein